MKITCKLFGHKWEKTKTPRLVIINKCSKCGVLSKPIYKSEIIQAIEKELK